MNAFKHASVALYLLAGMFLGVGFEHMGPDIGAYVVTFLAGGFLMLLGCAAANIGENGP